MFNPHYPNMPMSASANPQAEAQLAQVMAQTIGPIAHLEKNFDSGKMQSMMLDYVNRASKRVAANNRPFKEVAEDFGYKFFESFWKAYGESPWLEQVDFSGIVGAGMRLHFPQSCQNVAPDDFNNGIIVATNLGFDSSRYYSWANVVLKQVVSGKATQKKVRDAVDNTREELLKQTFETAESFLQAWIKESVKRLGNDVVNVMDKRTCVQLFTEMIKEGGGIPLWLTKAAGGLTQGIYDEVRSSVEVEYAGKEKAAAAAWSGGGGGKGGGGSWGGGGGGAAAFNPMMAAMAGWGGFDPFAAWGPAAGGAWGGGGGGGGKGYSPY